MDKITHCQNHNRFIPIDQEELTALELIGKTVEKSNELVEKSNNHEDRITDNERKKVSFEDMKNQYKMTTENGADYRGKWFGLDEPTLSDEGMRSQVQKNRDDILKHSEQLEDITKNKWYYEKERIEGETFNATINKIINKASDGDEIIVPYGTYEITQTFNINKYIIFDFNNSELTYNGEDVVFNSYFSDFNNFELKNFTLRNKLNSNAIGIKLNKCGEKTKIKNAKITGGAYGIHSSNSYMYELENVEIYNPKTVGWYIQGDGGAEIYATNVYVGFSATNFVGGYGIEIERTTSTDKGGYYFKDVLVVKNSVTGATSKGGWYIHSSVPNSVIVLCLNGGGADGYLNSETTNDIYGFKSLNCVNYKITHTWITTINTIKCEDFNFTNSNNPYGIYLDDSGALVNALISNISCAEQTFLKYSDSATTGDLYITNIRTPLLASDFKKFYSKDKNKITKIYSSPTDVEGCFKIVNDEDMTKLTYMRVQADGTFELLNQRFESMFQFTPGGLIKRNGVNVINQPRTYITPTGADKRDAWDTNTITLQDLAKVVKSVVTDLKEWHGLFK